MNEKDAALILEFSLGDLMAIIDQYRNTIYSAILGYLTSSKTVRADRNTARRAVQEAYYPAAEQGLKDGGGEPPLQGEDLEWLNARTDQERANIDNLFVSLKQLRADPEFTKDEAFAIASQKADNYSVTLQSIYNEAKTRGGKNIMLTFGGTDGHTEGFPCPTCKRVKGQRHRAKWWVTRNLIPYPGNDTFECGCWQCQHFLFDDNGKVFTVPLIMNQ